MIELLVFDVDGCLSDGKITYSNSYDEYKSFNVKDGLGIASWNKMGKKTAIITGRDSKIVEHRAKELKITYIHQGIKDKAKLLEEILKKENIGWENVAAIGDDMNDFIMLQKVGWSFTPNDGALLIRSKVDTVLSQKGGNGAVREMIDMIIKRDKLEEEFIKLWS